MRRSRAWLLAVAAAAWQASQARPDFALPAASARAAPRTALAATGGASDGLGRRRLSLLLGGGVGGSGAGGAAPAWALTKDELRVAALFEKTTPAVVSIAKIPPQGSGGEERGNPGGIYGTGWVWDQDHVVTNFHVIQGIDKPYVTFLKSDAKGEHRTTLDAVVVGSDPASDVAVLKVGARTRDGTALPKDLMQPLKKGKAKTLQVGQDVFAFGNPFGLEHSLSRGIVSGVSRTMEGAGGRPIQGVIQTDASINPGNSGGPLLDSDGDVVGINTAILTGSGTFAGVGLAIPIETVIKNVNSIISKGFVRRPFLGIVFAPDIMAQELALNGIMVMKVVPGGPAEAAGLRPMRGGRLGDVVVKIDDKDVGSSDDLFKFLDDKSPGDTVKMQVQRPSVDANSDKYDDLMLRVQLGTSPDPVKPDKEEPPRDS